MAVGDQPAEIAIALVVFNKADSPVAREGICQLRTDDRCDPLVFAAF